MAYRFTVLDELTEHFRRLPGIGSKSAQRLAFHLLNMPKEEALAFADSIRKAKESVRSCRVCQNLTEGEICPICSDPGRNRELICVVESPSDVMAIEKTGEFKGTYHVLHGAISPMNGIGPGDLKIKELLARISAGTVTELIIATNPTVEGDATAIYLSRLIRPIGVKTTRLAFGLPVGGELEYADELTLSRALENRRDL